MEDSTSRNLTLYMLMRGETYNGRRFVKIIDGFGTILANHVAEQVQCLVELERFGLEKMKGLADTLKAER